MRALYIRFAMFAGLLASAGIARAQPAPDFAQVPEPGMLALAGIGAAAAIVVSVLKRRK